MNKITFTNLFVFLLILFPIMYCSAMHNLKENPVLGKFVSPRTKLRVIKDCIELKKREDTLVIIKNTTNESKIAYQWAWMVGTKKNGIGLIKTMLQEKLPREISYKELYLPRDNNEMLKPGDPLTEEEWNKGIIANRSNLPSVGHKVMVAKQGRFYIAEVSSKLLEVSDKITVAQPNENFQHWHDGFEEPVENYVVKRPSFKLSYGSDEIQMVPLSDIRLLSEKKEH